jgi:hypothetical protein
MSPVAPSGMVEVGAAGAMQLPQDGLVRPERPRTSDTRIRHDACEEEDPDRPAGGPAGPGRAEPF